MTTLEVMNNFSFFILSVFVYKFFYFSIFKLLNKEWPKTSKDYHIIHLEKQIEILQTQNEELTQENKQISQAIIKRI